MSKEKSDDNKVAEIHFDEEVVLLFCIEGECNHINDQGIEWIVDTGTIFHYVPNKELFTTYKVKDFDHTKMGNQSVSPTVGIGNIVVYTNTGCKLALKNARHILDLRLNMLAIYVLDREIYESQQKVGRWKLLKGSLIVAKRKL